MVSTSSFKGITFIVSTDEKKPDGEARRLIRREAMMGKNKGRKLPARRPKHEETARCAGTESLLRSAIPARIGSDLSFIVMAGERIEPSVLTPIVKCESAG